MPRNNALHQYKYTRGFAELFRGLNGQDKLKWKIERFNLKHARRDRLKIRNLDSLEHTVDKSLIESGS